MRRTKANAGAGDSGAAGIKSSGKIGSPLNNPSAATGQPVSAELTGSNTAAACGIRAQSTSPILLLCRLLVNADHDPARPLLAYRGETLCLAVRSIGEAARLEVNSDGTGFIRRPEGRPGLLVRQNGLPLSARGTP